MDGKPSLKGAWSGHVNNLDFAGHQPYTGNSLSYSRQILYTGSYVKSQHKNSKAPLKGAWLGSRNPL